MAAEDAKYRCIYEHNRFHKDVMIDKITTDFLNEREEKFLYLQDLNIFVMTWNIACANLIDDLKESLEKVMKEPPDIICLGFQEVDMSVTSIVLGDNVDRNLFEFDVYNILPDFLNYYILQSKHIGGLSMIVFAKNCLKPQIINIISKSIPLGPIYMANKGAVSISILTRKNSFCFVCAHLPAHGKNVSARNEAYAIIMSKMQFKHSEVKDLTILDHDIIYWFGDLNYRIDSESVPTNFSSITKDDITVFIQQDQLLNCRLNSTAFHPFTEPPINFRPTYKFFIHKGDLEYNANRPPAWCDRILYRTKTEEMLKLIEYNSIEQPCVSDHLPVYGIFKNVLYFYDNKIYCELLNEAYSHASKVMAQRQPKVELSSQDLDFGHIHFYREKTLFVDVKNTGTVNVLILLTHNKFYSQDATKWITFKNSLTTLKIGESTKLLFSVFIDDLVNLSLSPIEPFLETVILLKLSEGRQYFLTFKATYIRGCFGYPLELLIKYDTPLKTRNCNTLKNKTISLPLQVLSMTNYIRANISTAKGKLFQNVAVDEDMLTIMDMLDYSPTFKIENIPVEKVSTALLFFLNCLPKKLVSIHTLISPDEFLDKPFDSLLSPYDYMLRHMLIFFIEISKKLPGKKLPLSELAKIVQPFIFSTESLEMLKIPKDKRKIPAYPLLKICSHIN